MAQALRDKQGPRSSRDVVDQLTTPAAAADAVTKAPWEGTAASTAPLALGKQCPELPARLTMPESGPLARSLVAGWAPEGAQGAPLACTLSFSEHTEALGDALSGAAPGGARVVTNQLTCGAVTVAAELAQSPMVANKDKALERLAGRLAQALSNRLCR